MSIYMMLVWIHGTSSRHVIHSQLPPKKENHPSIIMIYICSYHSDINKSFYSLHILNEKSSRSPQNNLFRFRKNDQNP